LFTIPFAFLTLGASNGIFFVAESRKIN